MARPRALTTFSTNDYFLDPADLVASHYDTTVNICARCHNHFGASWTNSSAPPAPSPQYNMLLGTVGELDPPATPYDPSYHALYITNQCVGCHMQPAPGSNPSVTGHRLVFDSYGVCAGCHGTAANASNLVVFVANKVITPRIETLHASLDLWATTKAPATLTAKYGTRAWEYTTPGALSPGGPGPDAVEQTLIPTNIQKARFNLYLVLYDGSFGTHNGLYAITLLDTAQNWVYQELLR
jgi:cytochrome c553